MRLAIYLKDSVFRNCLAVQLVATGHAVLESLPSPPPSERLGLASAIARLEPHAVLLDRDHAPGLLAESTRALAALKLGPTASPDVENPFADEPGAPALVRVTNQEATLAAVETLAGRPPPKRKRPHRAAPTAVGPHRDRRRAVTFAPEFGAHASPGGLHRPNLRNPDWKERCSQEEAHLVLILQTCLAEPERLARARAYLDALLASEPALEEELAYRLAHGSWKIYWLTGHLCRWCAVIAHLLADTEFGNFPPPAPPLARVAHLHWHTPDHVAYPAVCLLRYGPNPLVTELITSALTGGYLPSQDEGAVAEAAQWLWGAAAFVRAAARAHLQVVDEALDIGSPFFDLGGGDALPRHFGVVLEFWGWHHLLGLRMDLRHTLRGVLLGTTRVPRAPGQRFALSHAEMAALSAGAAAPGADD